MTAPENDPEYNPNLPEIEKSIAESQDPLLSNFSTLYDAFVRNHVALDHPTNPGNHSNIQLNEQTQSISTQSQEIAIYTKKVQGQTDQIFMRYGANGKEFQITNYQIYAIAETDQQRSFISFLPGGIMVYFGRLFSSGTTRFNLILNPPVKTNIMGFNLGGITTATVQPNVAVQAPIKGVYTTMVLTSSGPMPDQFYLIFANL